MAITHVATVINTSGGVNGGTTGNIDTSGADLLVASISWFSGNSSISDSNGNTWIPLTARSSNNVKHQLWYVLAPTVGAGHNFTVSMTGQAPTLIVEAFSGIASFDQENGSANGMPLQTGGITLASAPALFISGFCSTHASGINIDSSFGNQQTRYWSSGNNMAGSTAYRIDSVTGGANPTWSNGGVFTDAAANLATFLASASAGYSQFVSVSP